MKKTYLKMLWSMVAFAVLFTALFMPAGISTFAENETGATETQAVALQTGWMWDGVGWIYLLPNGELAEGWQYTDGFWYYFEPGTGRMARGWIYVYEHWYYLLDNGALYTGWFWDGVGWIYLLPTGDYAEGWQYIDGYRYYFEPGTGRMARGWIYVYNHWYYLLDNGALYTGWFWDGVGWIYLLPTGDYAEGWQYTDGFWYYFEPGTGRMARGWIYVYNHWYYLLDNGALYTGWFWGGDAWYYLSPETGYMLMDCWQSFGSKFYHFDVNGKWDGVNFDNHLRSAVDNAADAGGWDPYVYGGTVSQGTLEQLKAEMVAFSNMNVGIGFVLLDINSGAVISGNPYGWFYGASTIKGPYVCAAGLYAPEQAAQYSSLIYPTISVSDNDTYRQLRALIGDGVMQRYLVEAGVSSFMPGWQFPDMNVKDLAKLWIRNYEYFTSGEVNSNWIMPIFQHTLNSCIDATLGGFYPVYSKPGWYWTDNWKNDTYNDGGIVMKAGHPYILAILSGANLGRDNEMMYQFVRDLDKAHSELIGQ